MRFTRVLIIFSVFFLVNSGCKKNNVPQDALLSIPAEVSMVTRVNSPSLMKKMDFEAVKKLPFYADRISSVKAENSLMSLILNDPAKSGIDLDKNVYFVVWADPQTEGDFYTAAMCSIRDADAFGKMIAASGEVKVSVANGISTIEDGTSVFAWNDRLGLIATGQKAGLKAFAQKVFTTKPENSIASNKDLTKLLSQGHDISTWFNSNSLAEMRDIKFGASSINIPAAALKENYIHNYVDFEKGEIVSKSDFFFQKELVKDINLFVKDEIKTDFSNYIPAENLQMAAAMAIDFKGIRQVMNENILLKKMITSGLEGEGITFEEITKALQGDILATAFPVAGKMEKLVAARINDKDIVNKYLALGAKYGILTKVSEGVYTFKNAESGSDNVSVFDIDIMSAGGRIFVKDDMLFFASNESVVTAIKNGGFKDKTEQKSAFIDMMSHNIFSICVNGPTAMEMKPWAGENLDIIRDFKTTVNRKGSDTVIKMKDKNTNSLRSIINAMNESYLRNKGKEEDNKKKDVI